MLEVKKDIKNVKLESLKKSKCLKGNELYLPWFSENTQNINNL